MGRNLGDGERYQEELVNGKRLLTNTEEHVYFCVVTCLWAWDNIRTFLICFLLWTDDTVFKTWDLTVKPFLMIKTYQFALKMKAILTEY